MDKKESPRHYSIGKVAKELDLPAYTIRYWETEFKQLRPRKTRTGRRVYTQEDLKLVAHIQDLLHNQGYTIKGARDYLDGKGIPPVSATDNAAPQMPSEREIYLEDRVKELEEKLIKLEQSPAAPAASQSPTENEKLLSARVHELEARLKEHKLQLLKASSTPPSHDTPEPSQREIQLENRLRSMKRQLLELHQILSGN